MKRQSQSLTSILSKMRQMMRKGSHSNRASWISQSMVVLSSQLKIILTIVSICHFKCCHLISRNNLIKVRRTSASLQYLTMRLLYQETTSSQLMQLEKQLETYKAQASQVLTTKTWQWTRTIMMRKTHHLRSLAITLWCLPQSFHSP